MSSSIVKEYISLAQHGVATMPSVYDSDDFLSLSEASAELPGRPHVATLHRWRLRGVRGIKLSTILIGGKRFVSREALTRFIEQTNSVRNSSDPCDKRTQAGKHSTRQNSRRAADVLDKAGIPKGRTENS